ncbi:hypothetical protein TNCV_1927481 [Trichonephila clavipes]|nr:hypothetical protein TNCV_1927481 [Trichonephila clavipes]
MDASESGGNHRCVSEIKNLVWRDCNRDHLTKELGWRAIGTLETGHKGSDKYGHALLRVPMTDICHYTNKETELLLRMNSVTLSASCGKLTSWSIVRRRPYERGLYARGPPLCVPLTSRH